MAKTLIAQSSPNGQTSNCGYSGTVPSNEEWYVVRIDDNWGAQGEFLVGSAGQTVNVSQCHELGSQIGVANGQNFHYMKKYRITSDTAYDCINGQCVLASQYNTPGQYQTIDACQAECGGNNYCPPGKVCIPNSEWSRIESLSNQLKNKSCS